MSQKERQHLTVNMLGAYLQLFIHQWPELFRGCGLQRPGAADVDQVCYKLLCCHLLLWSTANKAQPAGMLVHKLQLQELEDVKDRVGLGQFMVWANNEQTKAPQGFRWLTR